MQPANLHRVQRDGARLVLDVYNVLKQIGIAVTLWVVFMHLFHVIHRSWRLWWCLSGKNKNKNKPQKARGKIFVWVFLITQSKLKNKSTGKKNKLQVYQEV